MRFTLGGLFSGISGLELGLEWGLGNAETLWQAEMDPFASAVSARHFPEAVRFTDVRQINAQSVPRVDLICGGFPCQPHSLAGKRESSNDERDLWSEFARIIGDVKPRWVVAENVPGLLSSADPAHGRGKGGFFGRVLRDLAEMGFDAEWGCFPAAAVGAHHKRDRVFLVAYASSAGFPGREHERSREAEHAHPSDSGADVDNAQRIGWDAGRHDHARHVGHFAGPAGKDTATLAHAYLANGETRCCNSLGVAAPSSAPSCHSGADVADADGGRQQKEWESGELGAQASREGGTGHQPPEVAGRRSSDVAHASRAGREEQHCPALAARAGQHSGGRDAPDWAGGDWRQPHPLAGNAQSRVRLLADGLPPRVAALRTLGNAVVPQQAAVIGRAIRAAEECRRLTGKLPERIIRPEHFKAQGDVSYGD